MDQCQGICLSGLRCKRDAHYDGFCYSHKIDTCGICLEEFKIGSREITQLTECGHRFCKTCVYPWVFQKYHLDQNCPTCRTQIGIENVCTALSWGISTKFIYRVEIRMYTTACLIDEEAREADVFFNIFHSHQLDDIQFKAIESLASKQPLFNPIFQKMKRNFVKKYLYMKRVPGSNPHRLHTFI